MARTPKTESLLGARSGSNGVKEAGTYFMRTPGEGTDGRVPIPALGDHERYGPFITALDHPGPVTLLLGVDDREADDNLKPFAGSVAAVQVALQWTDRGKKAFVPDSSFPSHGNQRRYVEQSILPDDDVLVVLDLGLNQDPQWLSLLKDGRRILATGSEMQLDAFAEQIVDGAKVLRLSAPALTEDACNTIITSWDTGTSRLLPGVQKAFSTMLMDGNAALEIYAKVRNITPTPNKSDSLPETQVADGAPTKYYRLMVFLERLGVSLGNPDKGSETLRNLVWKRCGGAGKPPAWRAGVSATVPRISAGQLEGIKASLSLAIREDRDEKASLELCRWLLFEAIRDSDMNRVSAELRTLSTLCKARAGDIAGHVRGDLPKMTWQLTEIIRRLARDEPPGVGIDQALGRLDHLQECLAKAFDPFTESRLFQGVLATWLSKECEDPARTAAIMRNELVQSTIRQRIVEEARSGGRRFAWLPPILFAWQQGDPEIDSDDALGLNQPAERTALKSFLQRPSTKGEAVEWLWQHWYGEEPRIESSSEPLQERFLSFLYAACRSPHQFKPKKKWTQILDGLAKATVANPELRRNVSDIITKADPKFFDTLISQFTTERAFVYRVQYALNSLLWLEEELGKEFGRQLVLRLMDHSSPSAEDYTLARYLQFLLQNLGRVELEKERKDTAEWIAKLPTDCLVGPEFSLLLLELSNVSSEYAQVLLEREDLPSRLLDALHASWQPTNMDDLLLTLLKFGDKGKSLFHKLQAKRGFLKELEHRPPYGSTIRDTVRVRFGNHNTITKPDAEGLRKLMIRRTDEGRVPIGVAGREGKAWLFAEVRDAEILKVAAEHSRTLPWIPIHLATTPPIDPLEPFWRAMQSEARPPRMWAHHYSVGAVMAATNGLEVEDWDHHETAHRAIVFSWAADVLRATTDSDRTRLTLNPANQIASAIKADYEELLRDVKASKTMDGMATERKWLLAMAIRTGLITWTPDRWGIPVFNIVGQDYKNLTVPGPPGTK